MNDRNDDILWPPSKTLVTLFQFYVLQPIIYDHDHKYYISYLHIVTLLSELVFFGSVLLCTASSWWNTSIVKI